MTPDAGNISGPIDFLMMTFDEARNDGSAGAALLDLVDQGIVALYDIRVLRKAADGSVTNVDLASMPNGTEGGFDRVAGAASGLLTEDDLAEAGDLMAAGTTAVLLVYENTWARPFIGAAVRAGGEVVSTSRIPAQHVIEVLDLLDASPT